MTNQVSISTATQGTGTAAPKAQASGKGSGFLGMLMAAIGHKPVTDASAQATGKDAQVKTHTLTGSAVTAKASKGKSQATTTLMAMAGDASAQKAKGKTGALIDAAAKATVGTGHAQATKASVAQNKAGSLVGAAAKAAATLQAMAGNEPAQDTKAAKGGHAATTKHHQSGGKHEDASGTASPTAMLQAAAAMAPAQPAKHSDAQTAAGTMDTAAHAQGRASVPMKGLAGNATLAAAAGMRTKPGNPAPVSPRSGPGTAPEKAAAEASMVTQAASTSGQAKPAATQAVQNASVSAQPTVDIAAAGMPATSQHNGKDGTRGTAKASSIASASSGGQAAKAQDAGMGMAAAHPQDAVAADSHAGSSDAPGGTNSRASLPQSGIQSYGQVAGGLTRPLPAHATLIAHKDQAAGLRADAATGPASIPGQDATAGNMAWAAGPGIGQNAQAMAGPQTAMPQVPVHSSGPWTAMAAMAEIGQAAANGHSRLELKLEPAHLGKVHVRIDSDSHKNIQIHLIVEQPASQQAIQQQLPNLRHVLEQQGLNLGNFSMSSQQQGGGQGSGQPGQQQTTTPSLPSVHGVQASTPQIMNAPNESSGSGRLSIRI